MTIVVAIAVVVVSWVVMSVMTGAMPSPIEMVNDWRRSQGSSGAPAQVESVDSGSTQQAPVTIDDQSQTATSGNDTVDGVRDVLTMYYSALAANDSNKLRGIGASDAASAIDQGWLAGVGYRMNSIDTPSATSMPAPVGTYAGSPLYAIADFYASNPTDAIHTDATGDTPRVGWVWYDDVNGNWAIVDPTIPTAIQTPSSTTVTMASDDRTANVSVMSKGAYANAWWAWLSEAITISTTAPVTMSKVSFDKGVTVMLPNELNGTINGGIASGSAIVTRGSLSEFDLSRIGQNPYSLSGDMMACRIQTTSQDITPQLRIGN